MDEIIKGLQWIKENQSYGVSGACDDLVEKCKKLTSDNTGGPKCPPSCVECPLGEICNVHKIGSSLCADVWRSLRASA